MTMTHEPSAAGSTPPVQQHKPEKVTVPTSGSPGESWHGNTITATGTTSVPDLD